MERVGREALISRADNFFEGNYQTYWRWCCSQQNIFRGKSKIAGLDSFAIRYRAFPRSVSRALQHFHGRLSRNEMKKCGKLKRNYLLQVSRLNPIGLAWKSPPTALWSRKERIMVQQFSTKKFAKKSENLPLRSLSPQNYLSKFYWSFRFTADRANRKSISA